MTIPDRPDILIVMYEQFCGRVVAGGGDEFPVDLPNLTRLRQESVCFEHAHCNAPVCGPSRLSFLSGLYPHRCGGYDNGSILPGHIPTFGHLLTLGGYRTALCGRMHIHGLDTHRGFEQRLSSEIINPLLCVQADFPGDVVPIHRPGPDERKSGVPAFSDSPIFLHDEYVTDQACRFLADQERMPPDSPFALLVGYFTAHSGFRSCPLLEPLYQKYLKRDLPVRSFTPDDFDALPEHTRRLHLLMRSGAEIFNPDYHRREMALYFARLEYADRQLGRLLQSLNASGRADQTLVITTGDHGENLGRHGLWGKMNFYEEAQRIPLSMRVPGLPPRRIDQPVSLVDCLPTFADFAGIDMACPTDGQSLRPLMAGERTEAPDAEVFSEYHGYLSPGSSYMLLRGSRKYVCHEREAHELYDLTADPDENHNLIADPSYAAVLEQLRSRLDAHVDQSAVAEAIRRHNQQRDMVSRCLTASEAFVEQTGDRARRLREALNEPWWDGGRYVGQWDPVAMRSGAAQQKKVAFDHK